MGGRLILEVAENLSPKIVCSSEGNFHHLPGRHFMVTDAILKKVTGLVTPDPLIAEFPLPEQATLLNLFPLVALDQVADPGNMGTLMRSALAFGWGGIFFLPGCCDPWSDKVVRASRAALFRLPWRLGTKEELLELKETNQLIGYVADIEGIAETKIPPQERILLLLSNEAAGPTPWSSRLGEKIMIPMKGEMESLNVAVAGSILMYAIYGKK
jgi:RNA methyltransferase, TrmH family